MNCKLPTTNSESKAIRLIVGLGNPGHQYNGTRHNIGFATLDAFALRHGLKFSFDSRWNAEIAKLVTSSKDSGGVLLMKPMTFMNLSGTAVASYARFHHISAMETLVVLDDVALPLGNLRLRKNGSAGGQRGLESILTHFSTIEVPRLRLGVASLEGSRDLKKQLSNYVLSRFCQEEVEIVQKAIERAGNALESLLKEDFDKTMNFYNCNISKKD